MNYPLLWDRQRQPKPAFDAVVEALRNAQMSGWRRRCRGTSPARVSRERSSPGVVVAATQPPASPRLTGEAPPPASALSLWYRAPASDHPLLPIGRARGRAARPATAEWVRALPVGNGRLGAMVFGGIVHERLQLNEDTLVGGPAVRSGESRRRKSALPEVRRLLAERKYAEAAKLVDAKVMSKPLRADAVPDDRRSRADVSTTSMRSRTTGAISIWRRQPLTCPTRAAA